MIGYLYIAQLFQAVLDKSLVIGGRFHVCPKWGSEMSNPNIDEQLVIGTGKTHKYPAALLMPPPKEGNFQYDGQDKGTGIALADLYSIRLLFVCTSDNTGSNQPMKPNAIQESTHTIAQTWHDMDRVAQNFCAVLNTVIKANGNIIFWDEIKPRISLVTNLGNDNVSGVMLSFKLAVFSGCVIEDYAPGWETAITVPAQTDIHPSHPMS